MDAACAISRQARLGEDGRALWSPRATLFESDDSAGKEKTNEGQDSASNLRPPPRAGCGADACAEHGRCLGIGVLRGKQTSPCDEGVLRISWCRRRVLYDHVLEPGEDQGR